MLASFIEFAENANILFVTKYPICESYFADVIIMDIISLNFEILNLN